MADISVKNQIRKHPHGVALCSAPAPADFSNGVVSAVVIVSGRHFALSRLDTRDRFGLRCGARPVGLELERRCGAGAVFLQFRKA